LDLELEFGGTEAMLELGGMALQSLRVECGATDATLGFATPNRTRMRELQVDVGAADFTALHLGNANADQIRVRGGVGAMDLDFSGSWNRDLTVLARVAIGQMTLRVPDDVGVRVELQRVAAGFDHPGLVKRDDAWYSANWDSAQYKLRLRAETVFGGIAVERSTR
jgi:predicted membrane protein